MIGGEPLLSAATAGSLVGATPPPYDRSAATVGVVHLGLGAFARAHLALYCDELLASGHTGMGICGVSLRSRATIDALREQDGLYTLIEQEGDRAELRVVGSVLDVGHGPPAALAALSAPAVRAVTLTVTEKGYCLRPSGGGLDVEHPDIRHDLAHPGAPRSVPGVLVAGLRRRRRDGLDPPVVLSGDNLAGNGLLLRGSVLALAGLLDDEDRQWIESEVAFPSTVVDRIVPATTAADRALVRERTGLVDAVPVRAERFRQWVIEDGPGLPPWSQAGATIVDEAGPWERLKLRLLNGPHSALAYLGTLAGITTIAEAVAVPTLNRFVTSMAEQEVVPALPPMAADPVHYAATCRRRFADTALGHRTAQVGADGSQKITPRLLDPMVDALAAGIDVDRLGLVVAAWIEYVIRAIDEGTPLDDPLATELASRVRVASRSGRSPVDALLGVERVFAPERVVRPGFRAPIELGVRLLRDEGPIGAAAALA